MFSQVNPASQFLWYKSSHCIRFQATRLSLNVELGRGAKAPRYMGCSTLLSPSCHFYRSNFRRKSSYRLHVRSSSLPWWHEECRLWGSSVFSVALYILWIRKQKVEPGVGLHYKPQKPSTGGPRSPGRIQLHGLQPPKTTPPTGDQVYTHRHTHTPSVHKDTHSGNTQIQMDTHIHTYIDAQRHKHT